MSNLFFKHFISAYSSTNREMILNKYDSDYKPKYIEQNQIFFVLNQVEIRLCCEPFRMPLAHYSLFVCLLILE